MSKAQILIKKRYFEVEGKSLPLESVWKTPVYGDKVLADFLGVSHRTVINWRNDGKIPFEKRILGANPLKPDQKANAVIVYNYIEVLKALRSLGYEFEPGINEGGKGGSAYWIKD